MRVLFLAVDGVLHPLSSLSRFTPVAPLDWAIQRAWLFRWAWILDELLIDHPEVGVVVHSNWRMLTTADEMRAFLGPLGRRFLGTTSRRPRWESIAQVIDDNRLRDFRILDALPEAFPPHLAELIACNPELGLKAYSVRRQIRAWLDPRQISAA